jgi:hypothetical protein
VLQRVKAVTLRFGDLENSPSLRVEVDLDFRVVSVRVTDSDGLTATALQHFA